MFDPWFRVGSLPSIEWRVIEVTASNDGRLCVWSLAMLNTPQDGPGWKNQLFTWTGRVSESHGKKHVFGDPLVQLLECQ